MWGSWVGCLAADLRDYEDKIEIVNFFTLHCVICLVPFYHIYRETFPVYSPDIHGGVMLFTAYHFWVCWPLSMYSGWNLNYMMVPPKEARFAGKWYRPAMCLAAYPFTIV